MGNQVKQYSDSSNFTKIQVCPHISAHVYLGNPDTGESNYRTFNFKCDYCGPVEWSNYDDQEEVEE